jgi:hypothetical protein
MVEGMEKGRNTENFKKYSPEKYEEESRKVINLYMNTIVGERYRHKEETISKWVEADRRLQDKFDNTPEPKNVLCRICGSPTKMTMKELFDSFNENAKMTFMYECLKCKKRQILYEDGSEWDYTPPKCPKCGKPLETDVKFEGEISIYTSHCKKCGYKKVDKSDHGKFKIEQEAKKKEDKELLEKYRDRYCLSEEKGKEYINVIESWQVANAVFKEELHKYDTTSYQKAISLKKVSIVELEKLLREKFEKEKFTRLVFKPPDIGKFVNVPFTVQDSDSSRKDHQSVKAMEKILKETLDGTNWRLLSNSLSYRLGYVIGQLKGVEQEEDMWEIAGRKKEEEKPSKIDPELLKKHEYEGPVGLARLSAKFEAEQNARKRRLEKEPDGFLLNDGKQGYTCGVCRETISGDQTWWDLRGIRCLDCQRNLKAGIVPLEIFEKDYGYTITLDSWDFRDEYGLHPATVRKLKKDGVLVGRDLKRSDGTIYHTIYLASENKEFMKKYKKNPKLKVTFNNSSEISAQNETK